MAQRPITPRTFEITSASDAWTIEHGLGAYPIVDVYIDLAGEMNKVIPLSVTYVDVNTCVIGFSVPRTGTAVIV